MFKLFQRKKTPAPEKNYILWVSTKHKEGGYSSRRYGWSSDLQFTYEEALKEKERLKDRFFEIEILNTNS